MCFLRRTVPVTTRLPREGEINGIDYTFLSEEEFAALEKSGNLLESGTYEGNKYGTPRPPPDVPLQLISKNHITDLTHEELCGAHPSSEGKRRRNRSNVQALLGNEYQQELPEGFNNHEALGPLPSDWERTYTANGEVYFVNHVTGVSSWLDPRLARVQKTRLEDCADNELPFGWERIDDPHYGTYYIDHVHRRTQYENPVLQLRMASRQQELQQNPTSSHQPVFTRDPKELKGQFFHTSLVKSPRGLGFTIVGGDDSEDEFLQIKSIVPNGPAWEDGLLQTGDVLVHVNNTCVLGFTHQDMVAMFQAIAIGERVNLEVCRGYCLPFDPNDPNTEIVTTVAVTAEGDPAGENMSQYYGQSWNENYARNTHSMPDLSGLSSKEQIVRPGSADILGDTYHLTDSYNNQATFLPIPIMKGPQGFGFTIADSTHGQKVKKILPGSHCNGLQEGDVLVRINHIPVYGRPHAEVVQALKECPAGRESLIVVQRENLMFEDSTSPSFRSKTPTAELYRTQEKEVIPSRPKTPLVDTRHWDHSSLSQEITRPPETSPRTAKFAPFPGAFSYTRGSPVNKRQPEVLPNTSFDDGSAERIPNPSDVLYGHSDDSYFSQSVNEDLNPSFNGSSKFSSNSFYDPNRGYNPSNQSNLQYASCANGLTLKRSNMGGQDLQLFTPYSRSHGSSGGFGDWIELVVTLARQETGFGFRIVGGIEEGSQVSIGLIVPGGAADLDGRLCTGDEIVSVDGHSVINTSHHFVVQLMGMAAANHRVTLCVRRKLTTGGIKRRESEGFGFVIITSVNQASSSLGKIITGSPAERCGMLHVGDRILAVNHVDIRNLTHGDIVNLIKDSGSSVTLTVGAPNDESGLLSSPSIEGDNGQVNQDGMEHFFYVELQRGLRGFGFSIRGGKEFHDMPLFVLRIADGGPAALDGRLRIGDQLIEINGISTKDMTHAEAIDMIKRGPSVRLLVRRTSQLLPAFDPLSTLSCSYSPPVQNASSLSQSEFFRHPQMPISQTNGPAGQSSPRNPPYVWDRYQGFAT